MPPKKSKKKSAPPPQDMGMDDGGDYGMYEQKVVIAEDPIHGQLELTEAELSADVSKILTAADPNSCSKKCQFQWGAGKFTSMPPSNRDMLAVHFHKQGSIFQRDSDEAKLQWKYNVNQCYSML